MSANCHLGAGHARVGIAACHRGWVSQRFARGSIPPRSHTHLGLHVAIRLTWKVLARTGREIMRPADVQSGAFIAQASPGIYSQFGLPLSRAYIPLAIQPTASFFHGLRSAVGSRSGTFEAKKPPFDLLVPGLGQGSLTFRTRLYPPDIAVMTIDVKLASEVAAWPECFEPLRALRSIGSVAPIEDLATYLFGVLASDDHKSPSPVHPSRVFVGYHLEPVQRPEEMELYVLRERARLVALLLGNSTWDSMHQDLIQAVVDRNEEINKKSTSEVLWVNKQGVLFLTPRNGHWPTQAGRFHRVLDLVELGLVTQRFLDEFPSQRRPDNENFIDFVYMLMSAWLQAPKAMFSASYANEYAWEIIAEALKLCDKLALTERIAHNVIESGRSKQREFAAVSGTWWRRAEFAESFARNGSR